MIHRDSILNATATRAVAPPAVLTLAVIVLLRFPPAGNIFYPRCPIEEYLHLQCPGCGATRALAALLNGRFAEALRFNALVVALLPFAGAYGVVWYRRFVQREPVRWPQTPPAAIYAAFAAALLFTVLRNLPH